LAFISASTVMATELRRKEGLGLISTTTRKIWKGKPSTLVDKITSGVIGFLIGFKVLEMILNPSVLDDTQALFLSLQGNLIGGLLLGAAFVASRIYEDKKNGLDEPVEVTEIIHPADHAGTITIIAAVVGILGAKIFHNLENLDDFFRDPVGSLLSFSGLTFYGGLICATIAIVWYARKHNIKVVHLVDSITPGLMLSYGVGRIGCHLAGDGDWGIGNTAPMPDWLAFLPEWVWAYDYPNNVLSEGVRLTEGIIYPGYGYHLVPSVFPTAIYEVAMSLTIFAFLWAMRKRWSTPGMISAVYLIFNGTERFLIEKIRVNNLFDIMGLQLTQAEVISFGIFIMGVAGIFLSKKYGHKWAE
jgi:phosphatidylglycerol:prolipoprotein diacylglycerol transferase